MNQRKAMLRLAQSSFDFDRSHQRFRLIALAGALALSGCASYEHTKGQIQLKMNQPMDGIESLESATKIAPTDAEYKIDYLLKRDENARAILADADNLRADGKLQEAQTIYENVLKLDRGNARARAALAALPQDLRYTKLLAEGEAFLSQGKIDLALDRASLVLEEHPQNKRAAKLREAALDLQATRGIERSKADAARSLLNKTVTLQFNEAPILTVFEAISKSIGLNILLDRDVKPGARVTIFVRDIAVEDALDFILLQNQLEKRVASSNTIMVYPSTDAKKAEYEDLSIRSFQITNVDIKYLTAMLKTMLKLKDMAADERTGVLVIRDTPEKLRLAARLIAVHDTPDPEIMLEVEILEVSSTRSSNLGFVPPSSFSVGTPGTQAALTLGALKKLRANDLLASPLSLTLNFKLEDSDVRLLASPRIRARNREKAKIMIGDRVPTIINTVTPVNTGSSVITGNVTYQDVGLKLEFESQVYANSEVGIKISLDVSNIAAEFTDPQGGRSYQIGTRNANTTLRLKDGETQILGGLITDQDRNTASKIPGLGHLPIVGRIFGNNDGTGTRSEIVLAITPRIVRNLATQTPDARSIFSGTLNVPRERPLLTEPFAEVRAAGVVSNGNASPFSPASPSLAPPPVQPQAGGQGSILLNPMPGAAFDARQSAIPGPGAPLPPPPPMVVRPPPVPSR